MSAAWKDHNYYDVLEVSQTATQREIHDSFKRAKSTYSNDNPALYTMFTREEAQELMRMIEEAYEVLGNPRLRQSYDQQLMMSGKWTGPMPAKITPVESPTPAREPVAPPQQKYREPVMVPFESKVLVEEKAVQFDDGSTSVIRTKVRPTTNEDGQGQTLISTYRILPDMEAEIKNQEDFDGYFLQKVRQYKNINLDQLALATKVTRTYLEAVEKMDLTVLPAPVFVRGFVSHMARILGLNEKKVTESYMKHLKKYSKK